MSSNERADSRAIANEDCLSKLPLPVINERESRSERSGLDGESAICADRYL